MSVGIYFSGLYVKIYKIKSGLGQRGGDICFPLKTPSSLKRAATRENQSSGFSTRSDTNWPVQLQQMARSLKFFI